MLGDSPFGALGCGPEAAVDQRAATGWSTRASDAGVMVITLPRAVDVDRFAIDPTEACGSASSAATKNFLVETSTSSAGGPWTPARHRHAVDLGAPPDERVRAHRRRRRACGSSG